MVLSAPNRMPAFVVPDEHCRTARQSEKGPFRNIRAHNDTPCIVLAGYDEQLFVIGFQDLRLGKV